MKNLFTNYFRLREETGEKPSTENSITSKVKLQKKEGSKEFAPFMVNRSTHSNLRTLIKAFANSPNVGVGYTTVDKSKGEVEPQLKKKTLYLTGGAVRDHLKGRTPKNYDLVTDATISEIRMILTHAEAKFIETKPKNQEYANDKRYAKLPMLGSKNKVFYASHWDKEGKETEITVEINNEQFRLSPLSKSSKSKLVKPDKAEAAATLEDDAANRDFTINSLYIPLTTPDGENSDLIDPHGGAHHLKNGEIRAVGDALDKRLAEDPSTAFRYVKILNAFGDANKMSKNYQNLIVQHKDLDGVDKDHIRSEFLSGLENQDSDPRKYIKTLSDTGLLSKIFPDIEFNPEDMPEDFRGDRWLATAWILRDNDPEQIKKLLTNGGWSKNEANDIAYLVKMYKWGNKNFDAEEFYDMKNSHTGLTKNKIKDWMKMAKAYRPEVDNFLNYEDGDLSPYSSDNMGRRSVNPMYVQYLGRVPFGGEFDAVRRNLYTQRWKDSLNKLK
jgi:tRNA nucleotidyltransferase/poly(A) polymerase